MPEPGIAYLQQEFYRRHLPLSVVEGTSESVPGDGIGETPTTDSVWASFSLAAPEAASAIATTDPITGLYRVSGQVMLTGSGTPTEADAANVAIYVGFFRKMRIMVPPVKNVPFDIYDAVFRFNNQPAQIATILAGSTDVTYWATVTANKIRD